MAAEPWLLEPRLQYTGDAPLVGVLSELTARHKRANQKLKRRHQMQMAHCMNMRMNMR